MLRIENTQMNGAIFLQNLSGMNITMTMTTTPTAIFLSWSMRNFVGWLYSILAVYALEEYTIMRPKTSRIPTTINRGTSNFPLTGTYFAFFSSVRSAPGRLNSITASFLLLMVYSGSAFANSLNILPLSS